MPAVYEAVRGKTVDLDTADCVDWPGAEFVDGGRKRLKVDGKWRSFQAHRWMFQHVFGELPADIVLFRVCGERMCVNPTHMVPMTKSGLGRAAARRSKVRWLG